ncbi:BamA/TamA family outer membrane protein [Hymenobacter coalescens]
MPRFLFVLLTLVLALAPAGRAVAQQVGAPPAPDTTRRGPQPVDSLRRRFDEQRFLGGLKAYTKRKTILGKAASVLFNFTERREEQGGLDATLLDRQYDRHNYKVVRRVEVKALDAFGYNINDTTRVPRNILEKGGNALHIITARRKIRKLLLFRPGQELQPQALAETERLLRQTDFILDARVLVNEKTSTKDSVDLKVITKDVFSLSAGLQIRDVGAGLLTLRDKNFLARGHDFRNRLDYGLSNPQGWRYEGSYTVPLRNYLTAQARYRNQWQYEEMGASLYRGFVSVNTRYAYALNLSRYDQGLQRTYPTDGTPPRFDPMGSTVADAWVGRAFQPRSYDLGYDNPARIIVAVRALRTDYYRRPDATFVNNNTGLLSLGYSVRHYYKDRYLFGFGRTEDVPTGSLLTLTGGYDVNSRNTRPYLAGRVALAGFNTLRGYLYVNGEYGRYLRSGRWQEGAFTGELLAFTRLYHTGNWQWRHFFWHRSIIGIGRPPTDRALSIAGDRGLRGLSDDGTLRGTSRFVLNYEANVFTPVSFLGFRLAGIAWADAAWLSTNGRPSPFQGKPYTGFGLGVRLRNEYLAVRTIQLLFGFYPNGIDDGQGTRLYQTSRNIYRFNDFSFGQPSIVRYDSNL